MMSTILNRKTCLSVLTALLFTAAVSGPAYSDEKPVTSTTATVDEMCKFCVKRITARFDKEKSVEKVECSTKDKTVKIVPAQGVRLSPKTMWEILESIGKTPKKMVSPEGTFTSKPTI